MDIYTLLHGVFHKGYYPNDILGIFDIYHDNGQIWDYYFLKKDVIFTFSYNNDKNLPDFVLNVIDKERDPELFEKMIDVIKRVPFKKITADNIGPNYKFIITEILRKKIAKILKEGIQAAEK